MGVVSNDWFDRVLLSVVYVFKTRRVDRCSSPLPWDPLSSPCKRTEDGDSDFVPGPGLFGQKFYVWVAGLGSKGVSYT